MICDYCEKTSRVPYPVYSARCIGCCARMVIDAGVRRFQERQIAAIEQAGAFSRGEVLTEVARIRAKRAQAALVGPQEYHNKGARAEAAKNAALSVDASANKGGPQ